MPRRSHLYKNGGEFPADENIKIVNLLLLHWPIDDIATEANCSKTKVYRVLHNLKKYGSYEKPRTRLTGAPKKITPEAEEALMNQLVANPHLDQNHMVIFLKDEFGIEITRSSMSRWLQAPKPNATKAQKAAIHQIEARRKIRSGTRTATEGVSTLPSSAPWAGASDLDPDLR